MTEDLRFIADAKLIDKLLSIDASLNKQANILTDSLSSISELVKKYVLSNIDTSSPGALIKSVLKILEPGVFFTIHPVLGILSAVGQEFGFSVTGALSTIISSIAPTLESGQQVNPADINAAGASLLSGTVSASYDFFHDLRRLDQENKILKTALWPFNSRHSGGSVADRILRVLGPGRSKSLIVGFLVWFVKAILLSAGLLVGTGFLFDLFKGKSEIPPKSETVPVSSETPVSAPSISSPISFIPMQAPIGLKPSGNGEKFFRNDAQNVWVVPLSGNVRNTLLMWTKEIYPELVGHEQLIQSDQSFNRVANILESYIDDKSPNYLVMPPGYNRRIDVVNGFAGSIAQKIQGKLNEQNI